VSAQALVEALLHRCARAVPLNAFISLDHDGCARSGSATPAWRASRHSARRATRAQRQFRQRRFPTTAGIPALAAHRPPRNGAVVQRLLDAGALILGKANMQERNLGPGSVAGLPGLSVPAGMTHAGLPVGIAIDGPEGDDQELLTIGLALESLLPRLPAAGPITRNIKALRQPRRATPMYNWRAGRFR
jgi:Asp-tRNA(Asn)/Glu-tRNA(Gln) amidotransferase A subunit family amidase